MIENGPGHAMRLLRNPIGARVRRLLEKIDVFYAVPVMIAVAAFILAVLAYFAVMR